MDARFKAGCRGLSCESVGEFRRHAGTTATALTRFPSPNKRNPFRCQPMTVSGLTIMETTKIRGVGT